MLTARENYLIAAKGGVPEYVPSYMGDAAMWAPSFGMFRDEENRDFFGVKWLRNDAGEMPDHNPGQELIHDIHEWREVINFPDLDNWDWDEEAKRAKARFDNDKARVVGPTGINGIFITPVNMMGWVPALTALYEEPEEMHALIDAWTDFTCDTIRYIGAYVDADIIKMGDDVANTKGLFFGRDIWDEFYRPGFQKMIDTIHELGCLAQFHCCGNCDDLLEEILALDVDICELFPQTPKFVEAKNNNNGAWSLTGGFDRQGPGNITGASEEVVRQAVRDGIDQVGLNGGLIFWDGGVVGTSEDAKNKLYWIEDELKIYGSQIYK